MKFKYFAIAVLLFTLPFAGISLLMLVVGIGNVVFPPDLSAFVLGLLHIVAFAPPLAGYIGGWRFVCRREAPTETQSRWLIPSIVAGLLFCAPICNLALFDPYESLWAKPQEIFFDYRVAALLLFTAGLIALLSNAAKLTNAEM